MSSVAKSVDEARLGLFMIQAGIRADQEKLKGRIRTHLIEGGDYVLFRNSSLYLLQSGKVNAVLKTRDNYGKGDYLRFDGERVSRINPEYYLGPMMLKPPKAGTSYGQIGIGEELDGDTDGGDGSNNNNNNNNGNNNG